MTQLNLNLFLATIFVATAPYKGNSLYDEFGNQLWKTLSMSTVCVYLWTVEMD